MNGQARFQDTDQIGLGDQINASVLLSSGYTSRSVRWDDNKTLVALIDARPLTRESLSNLLKASAHDFIILSFSSPEQVCSDDPSRNSGLGLIILHIGARDVTEDESVRADIQQLQQALPRIPIVPARNGCRDIVRHLRIGRLPRCKESRV